jgi:microsomal dipeptidase-like Zn-dependent dipeptidase
MKECKIKEETRGRVREEWKEGGGKKSFWVGIENMKKVNTERSLREVLQKKKRRGWEIEVWRRKRKKEEKKDVREKMKEEEKGEWMSVEGWKFKRDPLRLKIL